MADEAVQSLRVDQWLWFARVVKSRTLGHALVERGKVRLNRLRLEKPSTLVKPGDVLTISLGPKVRVLEVSAIGQRRGPASEAALLYKDLTEPEPPRQGDTMMSSAVQGRPAGAGRPTKRERRQIARFKDRQDLP